MKHAAKKIASFLVAISLLLFGIVPVSAADTPPPSDESHSILWVLDVSGSMLNVDPQLYYKDAINMGLALAPENASVAVMSGDCTKTGETDFLDISEPANRSLIESYVKNTYPRGNTDFGTILMAAAEKIKDQPGSKDVYFIGDISDAGYVSGGRMDASAGTQSLTDARSAITESGARFHFVLLGTAPENSSILQDLQDIADATDGDLQHLEEAGKLPQAVETSFQDAYPYTKATMAVFNSTSLEQTVTINFPDLPITRARVFVTSDAAIDGLQAKSDGSSIKINAYRTFSYIDIAQPIPEKLELALPPSKSEQTTIYLLLDHTVGAEVSTKSAIDANDPANPKQNTVVSVTPIDMATGRALYASEEPHDIAVTATLQAPDGEEQKLKIPTYANGIYSFQIEPTQFGEYTVQPRFSFGDITITPTPVNVPVEKMELPAVSEPAKPERERPDVNLPLIIALSAGALLVIAAIVFAILYRKNRKIIKPKKAPPPRAGRVIGKSSKQADTPSASALANAPAPIEVSDGGKAGIIAGKLDIYAVTLEGGKTEIPPVSYMVRRTVYGNSVSLGEIFEQSGIPYQFEQAGNIWFIVNENNSLTVVNDSNVNIYAFGRKYGKAEQTVLTYSHKIYVVFDDDENEFEIYYHSVMNRTTQPGAQLNVDVQ